jgi:hypothetical protein
MPLAYIHFLDRPDLERPVDPGFGVDAPVYPGQGLPGRPPRPGQPIYPTRPGRPSRPGQLPSWGGRPVDPGYGVEEGGPGQLPDWPPFVPEGEGDGEAGQLPSLPPGTVWPPLPPEYPGGKAMLMVWVPGVGYRYTVVSIPEGKPDQGLPGAGAPSRPTKPTPTDVHHR